MTDHIDAKHLVSDQFKIAMRGTAQTVTIITATDAERHHGMTVTAVTSVSMDPPSIVICINRKTLLHDILSKASRFGVNVLHADQAELSRAFSGGMPAEERFKRGRWAYTEDGVGYLEDAQASVICRIAGSTQFGTHSLFIGEVESVRTRDEIAPLIYQNAAYCVTAPAA